MPGTFDTAERVILMDLNVALSSNFDQMRSYPMYTFIRDVEQYRDWMVDLLRPEYVILITARESRWAAMTLNRIRTLTGWQPDEALFNDTPYTGKDAPLVKRTLMERHVLPRSSADVRRFMAIESNKATRWMYGQLGVHAVDCERHSEWKALPIIPQCTDTLF